MKDSGHYFTYKVEMASSKRSFYVYRPSSLEHPKDNSVMFIKEKMINAWRVFTSVRDCLIFWPQTVAVPNELKDLHEIVTCNNPRLAYCKFFESKQIKNNPPKEQYKVVDGAYIAIGATVAEDAVIMPGVYIGGDVTIESGTYIGAGSKIIGRVSCGKNVVIQENVVIGSDGRTTERDEMGKIMSMPQFGGIVIGDNVEIGANTVIERGAIDDTVLLEGCKIDCQCLIGHNAVLGKDSLMVAGAILLGSVHTGEQAYFSGNAIVRNQLLVGSNATIGMGAVVTKAVPDNVVVYGNPARPKEQEK